MQSAERQLRELCLEAECSRHEELEAIEERSGQARELLDQVAILEKQLLDYCAGGSLETLIHEVDAVDADSLDFQIKSAEERLEDLGGKRSELLETMGREKTRLALMDGSGRAAEAAEAAQQSLAEIRAHTDRYLQLRLASAILRREIERYRTENQAPLLKRSSELFSRLTMGSFVALQTDYNEADEPVLLGVRPRGEKVPVTGMSEGTRDQLHLALRLASLEKYLQHNEPMPLIVDDILINFDDDRAEATLKVFEELAGTTQVIFFTHHKHLLELAERAVSSGVLKVNHLLPNLKVAEERLA